MPDPLFISSILVAVGNKVFDSVASKASDAAWAKLQGEPAKVAFREALARALERYANSGTRARLARPLLAEHGLLEHPDFVEQLARILEFGPKPDSRVLAALWKDALDELPAGYDLEREVEQFLTLLLGELRSTEVFRPAFQSRTLEAINENGAASVEVLRSIEDLLGGLVELLDSRYGELLQKLSGPTRPPTSNYPDFTSLIEDKTRGFVGRQFVFEAIDRFVEEHPRGYFFVRGDPGIGKSSFAAQLVKMRGCVHHFNVSSEGISRADTFLGNIATQLIEAYGLPYTALPPNATADAGFLVRLLSEVSSRSLAAGERVVVVVDALDECEMTGMPVGANPLFLPRVLPQGIYFVVTSRRDDFKKRQEPVKVRVDCEFRTLFIEQDAEGNIADIEEYLLRYAARPGIQAYIGSQGIDIAQFVLHLRVKSEGNFMYLHHVLHEIEAGAYRDLELSALPSGLRNYYEDHWKRMKTSDDEAWHRYRLPVLRTLAVVKHPVSIDLISDFSQIDDRPRLWGVLNDWAPFLHEETVPYEGETQRRFRVYHASFREFIAEKDELGELGPGLNSAEAAIADTLWEDLFGPDKPGTR